VARVLLASLAVGVTRLGNGHHLVYPTNNDD
jgi:hypothetical protein